MSRKNSAHSPLLVFWMVLFMCADSGWTAETHSGDGEHGADVHGHYMRYQRPPRLSGTPEASLYRYHMRYRGDSRPPGNTISSPTVRPFDDLFAYTGSSVRVDPALLRAVAHVESAFDPNAVSNKGASGLMQLMPNTAQRYGVTQIFNPEQNLLGGALHLRDLLKQFNGDKELALAAYNAGAGEVIRHNGIPPFPETQAYVRSVLTLYQRYRRESDLQRYFRYPAKR